MWTQDFGPDEDNGTNSAQDVAIDSSHRIHAVGPHEGGDGGLAFAARLTP